MFMIKLFLHSLLLYLSVILNCKINSNEMYLIQNLTIFTALYRTQNLKNKNV